MKEQKTQIRTRIQQLKTKRNTLKKTFVKKNNGLIFLFLLWISPWWAHPLNWMRKAHKRRQKDQGATNRKKKNRSCLWLEIAPNASMRHPSSGRKTSKKSSLPKPNSPSKKQWLTIISRTRWYKSLKAQIRKLVRGKSLSMETIRHIAKRIQPGSKTAPLNGAKRTAERKGKNGEPTPKRS